MYDAQLMFPVKNIVKQLEESLYKMQLVRVEDICRNKPKLRTFVTFKNFNDLPAHVFKPLSFLERKTLSKIRLGILPIRIETARYLRPMVPENQRYCYCNTGEPESEYHVLFVCGKYDHLRQVWLAKLNKPPDFSTLLHHDKFKVVLNDPNNVKYTAQFLIDMLDLRRLLNNLY